jgi:D-glycero-D-manno-heptose 1,7-bisphosphate phosphatase
LNRAVFLDRDGVITREPPVYAHKPEQLNILPSAAAAIRLLKENGYKVIVVSNQAGIAKGYYREEDTEIFNRLMREELAQTGAYLDGIYYCPHHPEATVPEYKKKCACRKPEPGMLLKAAAEMDIALKQSFLVGDKMSDIEAGKRVGCYNIAVRSGANPAEFDGREAEYDHITDDLIAAARHILGIADK